MNALIPLKATLLSWWKMTLNTLLPPRCAATGEIVDIQGMVTSDFWQQLEFIESPLCLQCGLPFGFEIAGEALCAACMEQPPVFDRARSAVIYNDASRKLILGFKYGDKLHSIHTFIPWLLRAGQDLFPSADFIIPVPLHPKRLRMRKFNQSALIAQGLAKKTTALYLPQSLQRRRHTPPQKGLSAKARSKNVQGAFCVPPQRQAQLRDKTVILVDDVYTSGATLNECARALKAGGVAAVYVLTLARVMKDEY
jgi:ComF family protein